MNQNTHISQIYYKLCVSDVLNSTIVPGSGCFSCQVRINGEVHFLNYQNVRISGLVVELTDLGFKVDDGTGIIKVIFTNEDEYEVPKIGDYIEVLGHVTNQTPYSLKMKCSSIKTDPMFEVRHMLEMATIHKDFFKFQFLTDDTISTPQTSQSTEISNLTQKVVEYMKAKNGAPSTIEELTELCGNHETTTTVLNALQEEPLIYQDGQNYFLI